MDPALDRDELLRIIRQLVAADGSEAEQDELIRVLRRAVMDPRVLDYIFWPDRSMNPEQILDRALAYRPISL